MLIGILSDSHGRVEMTRRAVGALRDRNVELLLHLGDIGSEAVLEELVGTPARIVLGNCDLNEQQLIQHADRLGIACDHPMGWIHADGRRIAFTHGHFDKLMRDAIAQSADYLLHGHSHEVRDERIGSTRVLNPGALFRASRYTAAVLEPSRDAFELIELKA